MDLNALACLSFLLIHFSGDDSPDPNMDRMGALLPHCSNFFNCFPPPGKNPGDAMLWLRAWLEHVLIFSLIMNITSVANMSLILKPWVGQHQNVLKLLIVLFVENMYTP